ncbi:pentatricopeptide repeat-containing protein At2g37310-like [Lolium rigidum]|uniref:pentatricopeptide repeat-containing protein At2g37310-like n=1 Tax=Lolium rigidum TaxID=89674 RepID=UPI001F5D0D60|nr:pentatricopeptide repeat-containing protein At2g37310-like [Lolium rigidum]
MKLPSWLTAVPPDPRVYGNLIQLCADSGHLAAGRQLHARLVTLSVIPSNFLASKLISLYSRAGRLHDARRVFDAIPQPSLFAWNAILIALSLHSPDPSAALRLFAGSGVSPDEVTVSALLKSLAASGPGLPPLVAGEIHALAFLRGLGADQFVSNGLITAYANAGDMRAARAVFDEMPHRDVVSWNSLISAYSRGGWYRECLELFHGLVQARAGGGVQPNSVTVTSALHACAQLKAFDFGVDVLQIANGIRLDMDAAAWNSVVGFYAKCGRLQHARQLLERMPKKDAVSYSAMITGYMNSGHVDEGMDLFRQADAKGINTWNALISGLIQNGRQCDVLGLLHEMMGASILPNAATLSIIMPSLPLFSTLLGAKQAHGYVIRNDYDQSNHVVSALIDSYSKAGFLDIARKVFELNENRTTFAWTSIISAVAAHGDVTEALALFNQMVSAGTRPDTVTFTVVLNACAHAGMVAEARELFHSMQAVFGISPVMEQYACMVSVLSRAGMLKDALELVNKIPFEPNAKVWGALFSGAAAAGDVELGRFVFDRLFIIEPKNTGNYVVMANLYSNAGKWEEAEIIRSMLWGVGLEKVPGCSWN